MWYRQCPRSRLQPLPHRHFPLDPCVAWTSGVREPYTPETRRHHCPYPYHAERVAKTAAATPVASARSCQYRVAGARFAPPPWPRDIDTIEQTEQESPQLSSPPSPHGMETRSSAAASRVCVPHVSQPSTPHTVLRGMTSGKRLESRSWTLTTPRARDAVGIMVRGG